MTARIHIVGRKNSGKTTLIVELVQELTAQGLRVGTIKHTHHHHELDTPGKDSHRHRQAGAAKVGIMAPGMNALFWPPEEDGLGEYDSILAMFSDCDLVIVEGGVGAIGTKIEVWRRSITESPLAFQDDSIVAVVSDDEIELPLPRWPRNDISLLVQNIFSLTEENQFCWQKCYSTADPG